MTTCERRKPVLLFTGGGGAGTEAFERLLRDRYEVHFADADPEAKPYSVSAGAWHRIPMANSPEFISELGRLCQALGVDLLIPGVDEELMPIALARAGLPCEVLLPPAEFVATHLDKEASACFLSARGLPAPVTVPIDQRQALEFPFVVKPRQGRGSRGVALVRSEAELQAHLLLARRSPDKFIAQENLTGEEYTVLVVANRSGRLGAIVPVKVGIKRGITLRAHTDRDAAVIRTCSAIHAAAPVPGCYNIQLIKLAGGECKPFEINPRISTTTCLAYAAGVDFVDLYLQSGEGLGEFQHGVGLKRSWLNEFTGAE